MMSARLDDQEYRRYVSVLQEAAGKILVVGGGVSGGVSGGEGQEQQAIDAFLTQQLHAMESLDTYPDVCKACFRLGTYLLDTYGQVLESQGLGSKAQGAMEVLRYNNDKTMFEEREKEKEKEKGGGCGGGWVPMVGHYDSLRSLHAFLSLLRALGP